MIRKRDSRSLCQARKTRNKAFQKINYFSCIYGWKIPLDYISRNINTILQLTKMTAVTAEYVELANIIAL